MHSGFIRDGLRPPQAAWAPSPRSPQPRPGQGRVVPGSPALRVTSTIACRERGGRGALGGKTSFNYDPLPPNMCIIL